MKKGLCLSLLAVCLFVSCAMGDDLKSGLTSVPPEARSRIASQLLVRYDFADDGAGAFRAENPIHGFEMRADASGVRVKDSMVLRAVEAGWADGDLVRLPCEVSPRAVGARLEYRRGNVVEWFVNDETGLEQGFTIAEPSDGSNSSDLHLLVEVAGACDVTVNLDGLGARITDEQGRQFGYDGLKAWDATGRQLACRMADACGLSNLKSQILLVCDVRNAVWPVTIDPVLTAMERKLTASDAEASDYFGSAVSIDGDVFVVGAWGETDRKGAAYVYERNMGGTNAWGEVAKLPSPDGISGFLGDAFGSAVAVCGDVVVIGAQKNDGAKGAAYVYERDTGGTNAWRLLKKLVASDAAANDDFGFSVAVDGDVIVVGSYGDESSKGAVYVFERNIGGTNAWGELVKLTAPDGIAQDYFGFGVGVAGDVIVSGAHQSDPGGISAAGAAYVFERNAGGTNVWGLVAKLAASDGAVEDRFGCSVGVDGDVIAIGAYRDDAERGAAYVFERNAGGTNAWGQITKLTASDGAASDGFGGAVSVAGDMVLIGACGDDADKGAAYVFERNAGGTNAWAQVVKLTASDGAASDSFGAVGVSGNSIVVGAGGASPGGIGLAGAAYMFPIHMTSWSRKTKLTASDPGGNEYFGRSIGVHGDVLAVGANRDDSNRGALYVHERNTGGTNVWGEIRKLTASDSVAGDQMGCSVAVCGDVVVGGAWGDDGYRGSAYVFERNTGGTNLWGQHRKMTASDGGGGDYFGLSIAVWGDVIAAGAMGDDAERGSAYVYERNAGGTNAWGEVRKLTASDGAASDSFGRSIAVCGDVIVVGAFRDDSNRGSAYVYERNAGGTNVWGQVAKLTGSDGAANDRFGYSSAVAGNVIVVGAYMENGSEGAVYVYERNAGGTNVWGEVAKLTTSDGVGNDQLGCSVGIAGDVIVAGAYGCTVTRGAVYVFERNAGGSNAWGEIAKLTVPGAAVNDNLGWSSAVWGDVIAVGAQGENGRTGAGYVFEGLLAPADIAALGTNGAGIVASEPASAAKGTDFGGVSWGSAVTNTLSITNSSSIETLSIMGATTNGTGAASFLLAGMPASVSPGGVSNFPVRFAPGFGGVHTATVAIVNNSTNSSYTLYFAGMGSKHDQTITNCPNPGEQLITNTVRLSAQASSGLPVTNFVVSAGPGTIAGLSNLTFTGAGVVSVIASQAGDTNWNAAPGLTNTFLVSKLTQAALNFAPTSPQVYNTTNALSANGGSGTGAISYAVVSGPGAIAGADLLWVTTGVGTVTVTAVKASDSLYGSMTATAVVVCARAEQVIDFPAVPDQSIENTVGLSATAGSGLTVSFAVGSGPGSITAGTNLSFTGTGTVSVVASQEGDGNWNAAPNVTNSLTVVLIGAPLNVSASDGTYVDRIAVAWDSVSNAVSYELWRNTTSDSGSASCIASGQTANVYEDMWSSVRFRTVYYYWIKAVNGQVSSAFSAGDSGYRAPAVNGDYTGNGSTDMAVYDLGSGAWHIRDTSGNLVVNAVQWGGAGYRPVPGDYDGDRANDLAVYETSLGKWYIRAVGGAVILNGEQYGGSGYSPVPGDYDGDGVNDLAVYDQSAGRWYIRTVDGTEILVGAQWGGSTYVPVPGDYDGDGVDDLTVYQQETGMWYIRGVSGAVIADGVEWGGPGFAAVQGDYDNDHVADLAVYEQSTGRWYVRTVGGVTVIADVGFGGPAYAPLTGDYDGDGTCDLAVYYAPTGRWYIQTINETPVISGDLWGGGGYIPVTETDASMKPYGLTATYRMFGYGDDISTYEHFFTSWENEFSYTVGLSWWIYEHVSWYNSSVQRGDAVPLYRVYNLLPMTHFWTTDADTYNSLVAQGWLPEGAVMYVWATASGGRAPVYRFYNAAVDKYLYTADEYEKMVLTTDTRLGYTYEGIAFYVYDSP